MSRTTHKSFTVRAFLLAAVLIGTASIGTVSAGASAQAKESETTEESAKADSNAEASAESGSKEGEENAEDAIKENKPVNTAQQAALGVGGGGDDSLLGDFIIQYSLGTTVGMGTFYKNEESVTHNFGVTVGYSLTDKEMLLLGGGLSAEFFTRSRCASCGDFSAENGVFLNDTSLAIQTRRWRLNLGDALVAFVPEARLYFPTSRSSRTVGPYYVGWRLRATSTLVYKNLFVTLVPELRYTHFKNSHVVYENAQSDAQNGSLNAPLSLRAILSIRYQLMSAWGVSTAYAVGKTKTYENNAGKSFWRDNSYFSLSTDYTFFPWLTVSLSYFYFADPLNLEGNVRNPFFDNYADYSNSGSISLSVSGTIN